jgi:hypothetical protein
MITKFYSKSKNTKLIGVYKMDVNKIIEESINAVIGVTTNTEVTGTPEVIEESVASKVKEAADNAGIATHLKDVDPAKTGALAAALAAGVGAVALAKKLRASGQKKRIQGNSPSAGVVPGLNAAEAAVEKAAAVPGKVAASARATGTKLKTKAQHAAKTAELNYTFAKGAAKDKANQALDKGYGSLKAKMK